MWEIKNTLQITSFLAAVVFGILICLVYDIFRASRRTGSNGTITVFITDMIFAFLTAVTTFLFLMVFTNGQVRFYILIGQGIGFCISRVTISRLWLRFLVWLFMWIKIIHNRISGILHCFSVFIFTQINRFLKNIKKIFKNALNKAKKLLKKV
ncbi:MAG: hypothetical protein E7562_00580 [Ruminococcaceae bacterium]|nr:hypothetical protein [Oscillospiraceae bacterium]